LTNAEPGGDRRRLQRVDRESDTVSFMARDSERAQAVFDALDGAFPGDGIAVAVTAVDAGGSGPRMAGVRRASRSASLVAGGKHNRTDRL
jgi:hypothetical protein